MRRGFQKDDFPEDADTREPFKLDDISDLQAARCHLRFQCDNNVLSHAPSHTNPTNTHPYLHVVEDAWFLEVELDVHAALPKSFPAPAQVVVAGPHPQLLGLYEVISS